MSTHSCQLQHHLPQAVALHLCPAAVLPVGMGHERKHSLSVLMVGVGLRILAAMPPEADWLMGPLGGVPLRVSCTTAGHSVTAVQVQSERSQGQGLAQGTCCPATTFSLAGWLCQGTASGS